MPKSKFAKSIIPEPPAAAAVSASDSDDWMTATVRKIHGMQNGTMQILIHDWQVVQIEWTDRVRFNPPFDT